MAKNHVLLLKLITFEISSVTMHAHCIGWQGARSGIPIGQTARSVPINRELCSQLKQGDVDSVGSNTAHRVVSLEKGECAEPGGLEPRRGIPRETKPGEPKWT